MTATGTERPPDRGGPFGSAASFGRVFGVPLRMHWSALLLAVVLGTSLGASTLPAWAPGHSRASYLVSGLAGAGLLIVSLVLHEGAHALIGRRAGVPVHDMTIWALGGMTRMEPAERPPAAFGIAVSGPLTSLVLGAIGVGAALGLLRGLHWTLPGDVLLWVGWINVLLAVFNLLPAAPLDGGRVLQSLVWWRTGDRARGEQVAGRSGQVAGAVLAAIGALALLRGVLDGLWFMLMGFFITMAAQAEVRQATLQSLLHDVLVSEVMSAPVATGPDWFTVDRFVDDVAATGHHSHLALLDFEGRPAGIVSLRQLSMIPAASRQLTRVGAVALPMERCPTAAPGDRLGDVVARLTPGAPVRVLVLDGGGLVGIVTAHDVSRFLQHRMALRAAPARHQPH
jgi:Zn-dependent protease/predicted transcriptional regulator